MGRVKPTLIRILICINTKAHSFMIFTSPVKIRPRREGEYLSYIRVGTVYIHTYIHTYMGTIEAPTPQSGA
jgi:hypothetical protein